MNEQTLADVRRFVENNPNAEPMGVLGQLNLPPTEKEAVEAIIAGESVETDSTPAEAESRPEAASVSPGAHYARDGMAALYEQLGQAAGGLTPGNYDFVGWYHTDEASSPQADGRARPNVLSRDFDELRGNVDRVIYATTSYAPPSFYVEAWEEFRYGDDGREWCSDGNPMPDYPDLVANAPFADIDLEADAKAARRGGDLPKADIEAALQEYIDAFAALAGDRDAVFSLDSVGGAYVMIAPSATRPIADKFDREARGQLFGELGNRLDDWLENVRDSVAESVPEVAEMFGADLVNNKNRMFKAPLSVHKDLDGVVHPLATEAVEFDYLPLEEVAASDVDEAQEWAADYTADYEECISSIVATLWPDYYGGDWERALRHWLEDQKEEERERARAREEAAERRRERLQTASDARAGQRVTPHVQDVYDAIDALDIEAVAGETVVYRWTDSVSGSRDTSGDGKRAFVPTWGTGANGTANYINLDKGTWVDTGSGDYGTAVEMALIAEENWTRGVIARGEDWRRGVDALRRLGYDLPVYIPDVNTTTRDGDEFGETPYWAMKKAAVVLGVCTEKDFVEREGDDGGTYEGFPNASVYNATLDALEDAGIEHGRDCVDGARSKQTPAAVVDRGAPEDEQKVEEFVAALMDD